MSIVLNMLENKTLTKYASGTASAVIIMTGVKAIGRPAFIYADKNSDAETKNYTATKEFLYQILCLGITIALIPLFKFGGLKMAEKHLKIPELSGLMEEMSGTKNLFKKLNIFKVKYKEFTKLVKENKIDKTSPVNQALTIAHGGTEVGSFVGSVIGLTVLAPLISHKILHPIMHAMGLGKKDGHSNTKPIDVKA